MPRPLDSEILIQLESFTSNDINASVKDDYYKTLEDRYLSSYCRELGVEPLAHHKAYIAKQAPLEECEIEADWNDRSCIATNLRIVQPLIGKKKEGATKQARKLTDAQRVAEWFGRATYFNVDPPEPPDVIKKTLDSEAEAKVKAKASKDNMQLHAFTSMQLQHMKSSELAVDNFMPLTDELEKYRVRVRSDLEDESGKADVFGRLLKSKGRREADEIELANLKQKYLLPFACERTGSSKLLPWQSSEMRYSPHIHVPQEFLEESKKPLRLTMDEISEECFAYAVMRFPVELLTTRVDPELFAAVREQLVTEEAVRLVGLTAHFLYWIVLEHIHEAAKRLPDSSKQSMMLTMQELWAMMQAPARQRLGRRGELLSKDGPAGISFVIPAFMLALKRGVEWCFQQSYPWISNDPVSNTQLVDQINVLFMRLFDPDCLYASFGSLLASKKSIDTWHKLSVMQASLGTTPARKVINQEFRTTPLMQLLMVSDGNEPTNPKTRVLLKKSQSEPMINPHIKPDPTKPADKIPVPSWGRTALFRSANKRLMGLQRVGSECVKSNDSKKPNPFMRKKKTPPIDTGGTITRSSGSLTESTTTFQTMSMQ